ncbi:(2Fe-2S)-binding protein [Maricaulis sp.]|jgi:bacterioferritin-associated ferredoxin|uniref:(2Fe-2S)-binding protein n=1 Tax=Maricaulis sp. TaxID=1486257 RepID=UPI0026128CD1|nr:(2Fe-2S)-binding protein [Maricaulis sp.]
MYICICNALREKDLKSAASAPDVRSAACVFKRCDARPQCGRCIPDVAEIVSSVEIRRAGEGDSAA